MFGVIGSICDCDVMGIEFLDIIDQGPRRGKGQVVMSSSVGVVRALREFLLILEWIS